MTISPHFTLRELCRSESAARLAIPNVPTPVAITALEGLCKEILEPIVERFATTSCADPVLVRSGFRSPTLNRHVGGSVTSQHTKGEAADIEVRGVSNLELARWIHASALPFDQLILELYVPGDPTSGWVHVSRRADGKQRRQTLTAVRQQGGLRYLPGLPDDKETAA